MTPIQFDCYMQNMRVIQNMDEGIMPQRRLSQQEIEAMAIAKGVRIPT